MKKIISLVLVLVMVAAMAVGCGKSGSDKHLEGKLTDVIDKIYEKKPLEIMLMKEEVDPTDADQEWMFQSNTGLQNGDDVSEVAVSAPMMNAIAYGLTLVRVKDASKAKTVAEQMKNGIDPGKWICVRADEVIACGYGDVVMLVMTSSEAEFHAQELVDAFKDVCGGDLDFVLN